MINFPHKPTDKETILKRLDELSNLDLNPRGGRLFAHFYDTDIDELYEVAKEAYLKYIDKTMLNFTVYPSILKLENQVVSMAASLFHGDNSVVGNFTYGGTESIFIAMKSARDYFLKEKGKDVIPEIILPITGHPAFYKSAYLLRMKVKVIPVESSTYKVNVGKVVEAINNKTAVIVGSSPNYPYGSIDDIKSLSDIAIDHKIWLHVDACIGGFILPFLRMLGEDIPKFDFELDGVISLSADLHKYGYVSKGASIILYKSKEYRVHQIYVNASWPGYPLVNTTLLSSRSAGPLAASWAVINYLGIEGYLKLAKKILNARERIIDGLERIGFKILGKPESSIVTFTSEDVNMFLLADYMKKKGWYIQLQPGSKYLGFPPSIHLTISPIHDKLAKEFLKDLSDVSEVVKNLPTPPVKDFIEQLGIHKKSVEELSKELPLLIDALGISGESISGDMAFINMLMHELPPETVEYIFKLIINELFIERS